MRPFVLALVVNDTLFSTIIGVSFTACLSLIAWVVKTLVKLDGRVARMDDRLGDLELATNGYGRSYPNHLKPKERG